MNQNPEQLARDNIDRMLDAAGWTVQELSKLNPTVGLGVAVKEYPTDTGKTFTAITFIYRLLKFANAKRVLFLVDTKNLGEQAEQEFMAYTPNDDKRKFTELYTVQRLKSGYVGPDSQVCISTIQRMYSFVEAGAGLFRRVSHRLDRDAGQAHVRIF